MKNEKKRWYGWIPNVITISRIIGTACMFFMKPLTIPFYVLYTLCGVTDVLHGCVARATNTVSEFGSKLDSIADLLFYAVMLFRIFPVMWRVLPKTIWLGVAAIVVLRIVSYLVAAYKYGKFASLHTYMNKMTGFFVFGVPYFLTWAGGVIYCKWVCLVAAVSTLEEFLIHCCSREYTPSNKTLLKTLQHNCNLPDQA